MDKRFPKLKQLNVKDPFVSSIPAKLASFLNEQRAEQTLVHDPQYPKLRGLQYLNTLQLALRFAESVTNSYKLTYCFYCGYLYHLAYVVGPFLIGKC